MLRDFERILPDPTLPAAGLTIIPVKAKNARGWKPCHQPFFWPHEWFAALYRGYPIVFTDKLVGGSEAKLQKFWQVMLGSPLCHPVSLEERADFPAKAIPICIGGDGVPGLGVGKSWQRGVDVWFWYSLLAPSSSMGTYWLITAIWGHLLVDKTNVNTKKHVLKKLHWSFMALLEGTWPTRDENGRRLHNVPTGPLAEGWYCVPVLTSGDLDWYSKWLGLPHVSTNHPCLGCPCSKQQIMDFSTNAEWLDLMWTAEAWLLANPLRSWLFRLPGMSTVNVVRDYMHNKHIGTDQCMYASAI